MQSSGRAGRGEKPGQVIIQTRDVNHYCWQYVKNGDYEGFYDYEIALRKRRRYPPFINLALLRISYPMDWADGPTQLARITALLRSESKGVTVLAPRPRRCRSCGDAGGFSASSRLETGNPSVPFMPCFCLSPRPRTCVFHWISTP